MEVSYIGSHSLDFCSSLIILVSSGGLTLNVAMTMLFVSLLLCLLASLLSLFT